MKIQRSHLIVGLIALTLFMLTQWNLWTGALERDEGEYAYPAQILRAGGIPYVDFYVTKPPIIIYLNLFTQVLSDSPILPIRVLASLFILGAIVITALIANKRGGKMAGTAVLMFLPIVLANPSLSAFAANTEKFMILPMMGVLALITYFPRERSFKVAVLAGALAGLAVLIKPICIPPLLCIFIFWAWQIFRETRSGRFLFWPVGGWAGGFLVTVLMVCFPVILHGAWGNLWECAVTFNLHYAGSLGWSPVYFIGTMSELFSYGWPLFLLLGLLPFTRYPWRFFDVALLLTICVSVYKDPNGHQYIMLIPVWVLVSACLMDECLQARLPVRRRSQKALWSGMTIAIVSCILLWPLREQLWMSSNELFFNYYLGEPFYESPMVAEVVHRLTGPEDKVYIAGSEPQILYYSRRRSPVRFAVMYPLTFRTPLASSYQQEVMGDLDREPPKVIVWTSAQTSWGVRAKFLPSIPIYGYLEKLIGNSYVLHGGWIRQGTEKGRYKEGLTDEEIKLSSLLVYQRRP